MSTQPIIPPNTPVARPFGPLWRVVLICGAILTIGLIAALWPFLTALAQALTSWSATIAVLLIVGALGLLAGGVGIIYAAALRRIGVARQAHILTLPGGLPAHVADVRRSTKRVTLADQWQSSMEQFSAVELADRQRALPLVTSYHQAITQLPTPQIAALADAAPQLPALSTESEWLTWTDQTPHLMVAGRTDSGKTTTVEAILARRILAGDLVLVVDPHYQAGKWLGAAAVGGGRDYAACYQVFDAARALLDRRYKSFDAGTRTEEFRRITLVVDEVPAIIAHAQMGNKALYERWLLFATSLGSEARKVRISVILSTQTPLVRDIGISSAMRENFARIALGDTAADLLRDEPSAVRKQALLELLRGRPFPAAMEYRNNWYALRNDDIPQLAQTNGAAPRVPTLLLPIKAPQQQRTITSGLPPTQRVAAQAAPPTVPMNITVPEQILDLLVVRGYYMTASEISAALRIDLQLARTETSALTSAGRLIRRKCSGRTTAERYEYASKQINAQLTPSA